MSSLTPSEFIAQVNTEYERVHRDFEEQFWGTKMALKEGDFSVEKLGSTKAAMEAFLADEAKLKTTRELLASGTATDDEKTTLAIFERTFGCYIMESAEAKTLREKCTAIEGKLEDARNKMKLGKSVSGTFEELSSVGLRTRMRVDASEVERKACWEGLRSIGPFVLQNGFIELVRTRNAMARALGYVDFYEYKVTQAEGFGKEALFKILDTLEVGTRDILAKTRAELSDKMGEAVLQPWNTSFMVAGDVTKKLDPYFPFERSVLQWGRSFAALGIAYADASMHLDLLDRKGKYSNGFCHWPQPAWRKADGSWQPSRTNFTSLADPSAVGSGLTGLTTLMHEAGHAAHFANIKMPSPLFSQERAPTSVAYAETQSMFLDSLVGDAAWRQKYARDRAGMPIPWEIIEEDIRTTHPTKVLSLRAMLAVPYFEKALYELPDDQLDASTISNLADQIEHKIQGGLSSRPLLSVPHLLSDEASCYYHGYVLAEMAVHQTRDFFLKRDGYIVDNPSVGPTLNKSYWAVGNSQPFLTLVENLTKSPLMGDAWVGELNRPVDTVIAEEKEAYDKMAAKESNGDSKGDSKSNGDAKEEVKLDMHIKIVDGDDVIADTDADGGFLQSCQKFEEYIRDRFSSNKRAKTGAN